MATVVNARDTLLQAASSRVANVTMTPNINVTPEQVTGLGLILTGARSVQIKASTQVFVQGSNGVTLPSGIPLTVYTNNLSASPTISVVSGTISPAPEIANGVVLINEEDLDTDSATLELSVTQDSLTFTDKVTLYRLVEGSSTIVGLLTEEQHTVPSDKLGNVLNYQGASGNFKVYQGKDDITSACTFSVHSNPDSVTCSIGATTGAYAVTGAFPTASESIAVTFRATFGATTVDKVFTLQKSKAISDGQDGSDGADGQRGSRTFYVTLSGTTDTYSDSLATTTASVDGGPILNDVVTQSNSSEGFSQTKFWDGSAWQIVNAVVDGNLLVDGTVGAEKIVTPTLTAIQASLGTAQIDSGGYLRTAGATAFGTGDGIWMGYDSSTYKFRVGNPSGNRLSWDGTNLKITGEILGGDFTGYAWPASGGTGYYLGPSGLMIGNLNDDKYFHVTASGNIYSKAYDMVDGVMTLKQVNVVNTANIAAESVTVPRVFEDDTDYNGIGVGTYTVIGSHSVSMPSAGKAIIMWKGISYYFANTPVTIEIYVNGVKAGYTKSGDVLEDAPFAIGYGDFDAGTNTVEIRLWASSQYSILDQKVIVLGTQR